MDNATVVTVDEIAELFNHELERIERTHCARDSDMEETFVAVQAVIDKTCALLAELEKWHTYTPESLRAERKEFRRKIDRIISKSYFLHRTRTWPEGYQGDSNTLEIIYRNMPLSTGIGYYLDRYGLSYPLAVAVRNRRDILQNILAEELQTRHNPHILNIACGSCRELMGIANDVKRSGAHITCIDDDSKALDLSYDRLSYTPAAKNITFRKYNALKMFDDETNMREIGRQDIIYSVGLFDYLPDDFLIKLLSALYGLLNTNGKFILSFKDFDYYDSAFIHWIIDWSGFKQRNGSDFERIFGGAQIPPDNIKSLKDGTNIITFYVITKSG